MAKRRKFENGRAIDTFANQQTAVPLVIKMAAVKGKYYQEPHSSSINFTSLLTEIN